MGIHNITTTKGKQLNVILRIIYNNNPLFNKVNNDKLSYKQGLAKGIQHNKNNNKLTTQQLSLVSRDGALCEGGIFFKLRVGGVHVMSFKCNWRQLSLATTTTSRKTADSAPAHRQRSLKETYKIRINVRNTH